MGIEVGQIIKNLILMEAVVINKIQQLGSMYSLSYTGVTSNQSNKKVVDQETFESLEVLTQEGAFNLQGKLLLGDTKVQERLEKKQQRIDELKKKKIERLEQLKLMQKLDMKPPEVLGCAYVLPLSQVEYKSHYGMSRDDEVEAIAMETAMNYEKEQGWASVDVSSENTGYDIRSVSPEYFIRYSCLRRKPKAFNIIYP